MAMVQTALKGKWDGNSSSKNTRRKPVEDMSDDWYSTKEALVAIGRFHDNRANHPLEMEKAKTQHHKIMTELSDYLKNQRGILKRLEYTGSYYEGLKVGDGLEFDVMFILNHGEHLEVHRSPYNLYKYLKPKNPKSAEKFPKNLEGEKLCPRKVRYWFHGELQKWLNHSYFRNSIKLHYNGPAVMATVFRGGEEWYDVDLVPAYEIGGKAYVAKPKDMDLLLWRHSFSKEEKARMRNIDAHDNGCRKKIIRIIKVIRSQEVALHKMVSFYIKSKVLEMDEANPFLQWSDAHLALRLKDVLLALSSSMEQGVQRHPYDESTNLLEDLSLPTRMDIANRLKRIATSEKVAKGIFLHYEPSFVSTNFRDEVQGSHYRPSFEGIGAYDYHQYRASADHYPDDDSDDDDRRGVYRFSQQNQTSQESDWSSLAVGAAAVGAAGLLAYGFYKLMQPDEKDEKDEKNKKK